MYMKRLRITGAFCWLFTTDAIVAHAWATGVDSTCIHNECNEKKIANTHLYIVNQALDYIKQLAESTDVPNVSDFATEIYERMNTFHCRNLWEQSLFDTDGPNLADIPRLGSHFYNPTNTDFYGFKTNSKTYKLFGLTMELFGTAKSNSNDWIKSIDDLWNDDED